MLIKVIDKDGDLCIINTDEIVVAVPEYDNEGKTGNTLVTLKPIIEVGPIRRPLRMIVKDSIKRLYDKALEVEQKSLESYEERCDK